MINNFIKYNNNNSNDMGCQQSMHTDVVSSFDVTKSASAFRFASETQQTCGEKIAATGTRSPPASTSSLRTSRTVTSTSTVSLAMDEDSSYLLPKLDDNGHLSMEEIVRRTSSSLYCSSLTVGEGTETFELQVSTV